MLYILIFMGGKEHWFIVCHTVSIWHVAGPWLSPQALDQNALETIEEVQLSRSIRRVLQPETLFETCWDVSWMSWMSWMSWNVMKHVAWYTIDIVHIYTWKTSNLNQFGSSDFLFIFHFEALGKPQKPRKTQAKGLARQAAIAPRLHFVSGVIGDDLKMLQAPLLERMKRERGPLGWKKR